MRSRVRSLLITALLFCPVSLGWGASPLEQSAPPQRQSFPSPGKTWVIEAYTRDLGGPQTVLTLHRRKQKVATYQDNILVVPGAHAITVRWEPDASAVTISCPECDFDNADLEIKTKESIIIRYQTN